MTSIIKVDNLQNQCGANIISESANVITIGASGDTVTLAAGASQSGFGRSGSVNWDTTPKTATPVTAVSGNGYFINTTSIAITVNLPSTPAAGDIVAIADYANTSATNNITVGRNGSKIDGENKDAVIFVNGQVYTLVYVDATEGWKTVNQTFNQITLPAFIVATGGTITTCGNYKIHSFTGPGTFTVTNAGNPQGSTTVDYLVVAGGGSGGSLYAGGGGGAGGYRESVPSPAAWTASPLANPGGSLPVAATAYPITVGGGGNITPNVGSQGTPSIFSTITSAGGGAGGGRVCSPSISNSGGSGGSGGGGGGYCGTHPGPSGSGNTPPTSPPQGNTGGISSTSAPGYGSGGGGGAGVVGANGTSTTAGSGGNGVASSITGSSVTRSGGGGGSGQNIGPGTGGSGGGGPGVGPVSFPSPGGTAGTTNTGGGGGGSLGPTGTGTGGSGIVVIRYKFQ
jgi:hypothetical protein